MRFYSFVTSLSLSCLLLSCSTPAPKETPLVYVEIAEVKIRPFTISLDAIGNVRENSFVQVRPQVQGMLLKTYIEEGQFVEEGDLLYEIDSRPYVAVLNQTKASLLKDEAALELARVTLKRNEDLFKKDFISALTWEQYKNNVEIAKAQVEMDKAAVETAQINVDYCTIRAPIRGKVGLYQIYPGNLVFANDPNAIIEIRQLSPITIQFTIPQQYFQQLQQAHREKPLEFEAILPYQTHPPFRGKIFFLDNNVNLQSGTIALKGLIPNDPVVLWPGEFVNVKIILKTEPQALVVPESAIKLGQKGNYVFVIQEDMTAKPVEITTGQQDGTEVLVTSGLKRGDRVVTSGQLNLKDGSKVVVKGS